MPRHFRLSEGGSEGLFYNIHYHTHSNILFVQTNYLVLHKSLKTQLFKYQLNQVDCHCCVDGG